VKNKRHQAYDSLDSVAPLNDQNKIFTYPVLRFVVAPLGGEEETLNEILKLLPAVKWFADLTG